MSDDAVTEDGSVWCVPVRIADNSPNVYPLYTDLGEKTLAAFISGVDSG